MKKASLRLVLAALLTLVLLLAGCGQPAKYVRIGTASMGGAFYPMGNALAQLFNEKIPNMKASAQATGGSAENCRLLAKKDIELALIQSATLADAEKGQGQFKDGAIEDIRAITATYFMPFHVIVRKDANINSIADLKGKKIAVGPIASGIEVNALTLLKAYGIEPQDFQAIHQSQEETFEGLKTGSVDAHIYATGAGSAQITDVMLTGRLKILPIDPDKADALLKDHPEFGPMTIKANTYPNQAEEIKTIAGSGVLTVRADVDPDTVYTMTKAIFENLDFLKQRHDYFKQTTLENATVGVVYPLHPGAEKYLKEAGAIK